MWPTNLSNTIICALFDTESASWTFILFSCVDSLLNSLNCL